MIGWEKEERREERREGKEEEKRRGRGKERVPKWFVQYTSMFEILRNIVPMWADKKHAAA